MRKLLPLLLAAATPVSAGVSLTGLVHQFFTPAFETSEAATPASIFTAVVRPDGHILVGGDFTRHDGSTAINLSSITASLSGFQPATRSWPVYCLALQDDGKVLVGGRADPNGFNLVRLLPDGSEEERSTFNLRSNPNGDVYSIAFLPDSRIVVGGAFTFFGDQQRSRIVVINPDGSPNDMLGPAAGTNGTVFTVAVQPDGKILGAGSFTIASGLTRNRIARWNANGTLDTTFDPGTGPNGTVRCFVLQPDGAIMIAGDFTSVNGQTRNRVARLTSNGALESSSTFNPGSGFSSAVQTLTLSANGSAYAGGDFVTANGTTVNRIARVAPNGALSDFVAGDGAPDTVYSMTLENSGSVLAGGKFTSMSGNPRKGMARILNIDDTQVLSISGGNLVWRRAASAPSPSYVVFDSSIDGGATWQRVGTAGYYGNGSWELRSPQLPPSCIIRAQGRIQCGWHSGSTGIITDTLAWNPSALDTTFDPNIPTDSLFPGVAAVAVQPDGRTVVGGGFTTVSGLARNRIARLATTGTLESTGAFTPGAGPETSSDGVLSLSIQPDLKILASGGFSTWNGQTRGNAVRLSTGGVPEAFNVTTGVGGNILCTAVQPDGKILFAGGYYYMGQNQRQPGIMRVNANGTAESSATWTPVSMDGYVNSMVLQPDGKILIAGSFSEVNGQPRGNIARLLPNGTLESTASFTATGSPDTEAVSALSLQPDGRILVGGNFRTFNGQPRIYLARLNSDGSLESQDTFNTSTVLNSSVQSILLQADGKILVSGYFTKFGSLPFDRLVRLKPDGTADSPVSFNPGPTTTEGFSISQQADGSILAFGRFTTFGGAVRNGIARLKNSPAVNVLTPVSASAVEWRRGGSAPEVSDVTFEISNAAGASWTDMGRGIRINGGWILTGRALPAGGQLRARGRVHDGSSEGVVQTVAAFTLQPDIALFAEGGVELPGGNAAPVTFASVKRGTTPEPAQTFSIFNSGALPLSVSSISLPAGYSLVTPPAFPLVVAPQTSQPFSVSLSSANGGAFSGNIVVNSNDPDEGTFSFAVAGRILVPEIAAKLPDVEGEPEVFSDQASPVDLGTVRQGASVSIRVGIFNTGDASLVLGSPVAEAPYSARLPGPGPGGSTVPPGGVRTLSITLDGAAPGTFQEIISLPSDDPDEPVFRIPVTGTVITPEIEVRDGDRTAPEILSGQPSPVDFGSVRLAAPAVRTVTVVNSGSAPLFIQALVAPDGFSFVGSPSLPVNLPVGESLPLRLQANAAALGVFQGNVRIASDDFDEPFFDFPVTALIVTPDITVRQGSAAGAALADGQVTPVSFGRSVQGTPALQSFTIGNDGTAPLLVTAVTPPPGYSAVNLPALPWTVPVGGAASFQISLSTTSVGIHSGSVAISSDDLDETIFDFPVTGEVYIPDPVASPATAAPVLNRQSGLLDQTVRIANDTTATVPAYNLIVRGLPDGVELNNASSRREDGAWVIYVRQPMTPHSSQNILLEYFSPTRVIPEFTPQLSTEVVLTPADLAVPGDAAAFRIDVVKAAPGGGILIEFPSTPGRRYQVQYSDDGTAWQASLPSIRAAGSRTQWLDRGLPRTHSAPASVSSRFYRVAELPAP